MKPFTPKTPHVNPDRRYYVDGFTFVKMDDNVERGQQEARNLHHFRGVWFAPQPKTAAVKDGRHVLGMDLVRGETLENLQAALTPVERHNVAYQLLKIVAWMLDNGLVHGDLNESNVLFDRVRGHVFLVDFEMARKSHEMDGADLDGSGPYGLQHLLRYLYAPKA